MKHVSAVLVTLCVVMKPSSWRATLTESDDASQEKFYVFCLGRMIDFGIDPFSEKQKTGVEYIFKCASIMFPNFMGRKVNYALGTGQKLCFG
jgi:hypothetical protein